MEKDDNFIHDKYGYCYYNISPNKNPIIFNLYIEPEYRGCGHARRLLKYVIGEIKKGYAGPIEIEAKPWEDNVDLKKLTNFYLEMGLKILEEPHKKGGIIN